MKIRNPLLIASLLVGWTGAAYAVDPETIDWKGVPARRVTLFYPGQSTSLWLRSSDHTGAQMVASGASCVACHKGQEEKLGNKLV